ncbi:DUF3014 domain-containing protein [Shewanella psychromarinicola]|uniref:DUF3014 domain-containing protein n=1 Tax=Shewanella psychromarinicola TaxID=2487742 RepID=A0A3N4E3Y4_9GAMM|nr:DUF3014 domain-containing protein [Shewanella psychromarinicola]AZG33930.1 DUF3014 domain-containing protein [Shewanella psychromarinicola]MCL1080917.1 DUF3014 domain-containing protein [Shewanella psychromarinicola]RPA31432.1 DUF3014 domain-containing protein [Shewanella psychromarinicola]
MQVNEEDRITPPGSEKPGSNKMLIAIAVIALLGASSYFYFTSDDTDEFEPVVITPVELPESVPETPIEQTPIEEPESIATTDDVVPTGESAAATIEPLPTLDESDDFVEAKTLAIANGMKIAPMILKKDIARQFVVFVDNLAQGNMVRKASPLKGPDTKFTVSEITNKIYLNPDSYHRYDLYANFIEELSDKDLISTYNELKPLFAEAFTELGYSNIDFDTRMQQVFSMVADTPIIEDPIELSSISVNYKYVDPNLEALPNAQKLLIRMGPENARKIKAAVKKLQQSFPSQ